MTALLSFFAGAALMALALAGIAWRRWVRG